MRIRIRIVTGQPEISLTKKASAAGNSERNDDPVAYLQIRYSSSHFYHFTHELMTEYIALFHCRNVTIVKMKVRAADCCGADFDNCVMGIYDGRVRNIHDLNVVFSIPTNCFHR